MDWNSLISGKRLHNPTARAESGRSPFLQDLDRIVFSSAFRRLAHKTQVHPLSLNDNVHTRLTHSIEVASVGRSLGTIVGHTVVQRRLRRQSRWAITRDTFGHIVQAACLAHDIGNPPFGHSGENAICAWFRKPTNAARAFGSSEDSIEGVRHEDFTHFEGNAQGFRILTQLENYKMDGGLRLTYAVLGTFSKYTRSSISPKKDDGYPAGKKVGFFESERENFCEVADKLGLIRRERGQDYWCRHPLAFLVEAADDICYAIVDIEDGFVLGHLNYEEARSALAPIAGKKAVLGSWMDFREKIAKLRAVAIGEAIKEAATNFVDNERRFLNGAFSEELIEGTRIRQHIKHAKELARKKIYESDRKTKLEIAGSEVIHGLLDTFCEVIEEASSKGLDVNKFDGRARNLARIMGVSGRKHTRYELLLRMTDLISGMTDRYAVDLYRTLKGITTQVG